MMRTMEHLDRPTTLTAETDVSTAETGLARKPGGPGAGLVSAGLLVLALVFATGLFVGQGFGRGGAADPSDGPLPTSVAVASPSVRSETPSAPAAPATPEPTAPATAPPTTAPVPSSAPPSATPTASPSPAPASEAPAAGPTLPVGAPEDFGLFWEALQVIQERYVDRSALDDTSLTYGAIRGMVESLGDTGHTEFLTPDEVQAQQDSLSGTLTGIGVLLGERGGRPVVMSVISGTPAEAAGVRSGDVILAIDGTSAERLGTEGIVELVRGLEGTEVTLTVMHRGVAEPADITIVRQRIQLEPVSWSFVPGTMIADVRLIQFSAGAADAVRVALEEAIGQGAQAIVLDLRSNPGGLVDEAVGVASHFLDDGVVYQRRDADDATAPVSVLPDGLATDLPLVVLIDLGTASSAEIVSGAIADNERGTLIGEQTFGTGTVLNTIELSDGSAVRVGIERWLTPDGELIFDRGITPDEIVELPLDGALLEPADLRGLSAEEFAASSDLQLRRAVELLSEGPAG